MNSMTKKIVVTFAIAIISIITIVGNVVAGIFSPVITKALCGTGTTSDESSLTKQQSDALCVELQTEGSVLLKNENKTLPLSKDINQVNVFGWSSTDAGFLLKGQGSGSSTIQDSKKVTLLKALEEYGVGYNQELTNMYKQYQSTERGNKSYDLIEPGISYYTDTLVANAVEYSDTAIVVLGRYAGEQMTAGEIPMQQVKSKGQATDKTRTYLEISTEEEAMLDLVCKNFENVVVLLNTCNTMHCGFLEDYDVDAAMYVGITGQSGAKAIPQLLWGQKTDSEGKTVAVTPSGKTADTYVYSTEYDPTFANHVVTNSSIQYQEDIYYGYKWYETANEEGFFDSVSNKYGEGYDGVVQYPFGYGLSYTDFEWKVKDVSLERGGFINKDTEITVTVEVKNVGQVAGQDVVQIYSTPPYTSEEIEKAHRNLVGFGKTAILQPNSFQDVKITFSAYDLASYDAYDKNGNDFYGYELDAGNYNITVQRDAHRVDESEGSTITYKVKENITFDKDPITGVLVENQFTGSDSYANMPIDASTVGGAKYMTRADFEGTFPKKLATTNNATAISNASKYTYSGYNQSTMPTTNVSGDLRLATKEDGSFATYKQLNGDGTKLIYNNDLMYKLGDDKTGYDNPLWETLINQMTIAELCELVECSGFDTIAIESVGKIYCRDYDGPAGFNANVQGDTSTSWTAYPSESLIAGSWNQLLCFTMGLSMGAEAAETSPSLNGWYAPGVNLHRSAYTARNYEYYSEDGVLSGKLAASVIKGAKSNGLYCYLKHFAVSEAGPNPRNVNTWLTEQSLRENYLKPFEIAVKEGESNAIMSAFNRVGAVWSGANYPLLTTILRDEWGFKGTVLTDYSTGEGVGAMNPMQGVRAGNDIWLNPNATNGSPLNKSNATDIYCAKMSAKNVLYTFCNTYTYAKHVDWDSIDSMFTATLGEYTGSTVFPWWIIIVVALDLGIAGGLIFWGYKTYFVKKEKSIKDNNQNSQNNN